MATGDIGGAVTELVITCQTAAPGDVSIQAGDAVALAASPYTAGHAAAAEEAVFGQALQDVEGNGSRFSVRVRGVCLFAYEGAPPDVDGMSGVVCGDTPGKVKAPASGNGRGVNLKVDPVQQIVHVLI